MTRQGFVSKIGGGSATSRHGDRMDGLSVGKQTLVAQLEASTQSTLTRPTAVPDRGPGPQHASAPPAQGEGRALPAEVQARMEGAFGVGFSAVRIHEGPHAQALGALAYTQGTDIHFAPGRYQPNSQSGQELLGHELAHVVQQAQGRAPATAQAKGVDVNDDPSLEAEADAMGARAMRGERARGSGSVLAPVAATTIQARRSSVVQRAMGMELETTVPIHGESGYHDPVYDNKTLGWKITSDDERIEFVTRPLETKSDLLLAIGQIQGFVTAAQRLATPEKRVWIRELVREAGLPSGGEGAYQIGGSGFSPEQFVAKPQVTVGVPLDRVTRLLAEARTLDLQEYAKQEQEEHEGKGKGERKDSDKGITVPKLLDDETARDDAPAPIDSLAVAAAWGEQMKRVNGQVDPVSIDRATGLMALVLRYLNEGRFKSIRSGTAPYVKAYFPVMARTDFTSMFKAIGPAATLFTPHAVLACWGCDEEFAKQTPILLLGFKDDSRHGEKTEGTNFGPKIWDWLISIAGGQEEQDKINLRYKDQDNELIEHYRNSPDREFREGTARSKEKDLLSRGAVALNSTSMGLFPMDSREGVESLLTVLEFRQFPMEVGLAPEQWATLADRLFDFYERSRSEGAGLSDVLWTKNTVRSIRSNILRTTNAMRKTRDEQFNDEVLQLQVQALARVDRLDPRDHQALSKFVKQYSEATRKYQQRFLGLDKTKAPSLTKLSGGRQLRKWKRQQRSVEGGNEAGIAWMKDQLAMLFNRNLDGLLTGAPRNGVDQFNEGLETTYRMLQHQFDRIPNRSPLEIQEAYDDFYSDTAETVTELGAKAERYRQTGSFDGEGSESGGLTSEELANQSDPMKFIFDQLKQLSIKEKEHRTQRTPEQSFERELKRTRGLFHTRLEKLKDSAGLEQLLEQFIQAFAKLRAEFFTFERNDVSSAPPPDVQDLGGNCLFESTSIMMQRAYSAADLRQRTANSVRLFPLQYVDLLTNRLDGGDDVIQEMEAAADFLEVDANWDAPAGELAPVVLGDVLALLGHQLIILNLNGSIRHSGPGSGTPVFIYYNGYNHYVPGALPGGGV